MQLAPSVGPVVVDAESPSGTAESPGALGLCAACLADPIKKADAIALRESFAKIMDEEIKNFGTWDPKVGAYRMAPGAFGIGKPRKVKR